jgi:hypothetical protein
MTYCSEADRAHIAAARAQGPTGHADALAERIEAERTSHDAAREHPRPRLRLVPPPDQPTR